MKIRAIGASALVLAVATAACGGRAPPSTAAPPAGSGVTSAPTSGADASASAAMGSPAGGGAIVAGTFKSGRRN